MHNIEYISKENILNIVKQLKLTDVVITDYNIVKQLVDKYNSNVKTYYYSRKDLHEAIEQIRPSVAILLFNSKSTIEYIKYVNINTQIYTLELSEDDKRINRAVEELESSL